jgi:hypothetical protein
MNIRDLSERFPGTGDSLENAMKRVEEFGAPPLIDQRFIHYDILFEAYVPGSGPREMRKLCLDLMESEPGDLATRFFVLNFYYSLVHYSSDFSEDVPSHFETSFARTSHPSCVFGRPSNARALRILSGRS